MRIVELQAENFKRLRAVRIKPDGSIVQITGRNAQGKTSVLDAIWAALGGRTCKVDKPVRDGAEKATVSLDLGDVTVEAMWSESGAKSLTVKASNGRKLSSTQAVLDSLVGQLTFDPLAFSRMKAAEQVETLKALVGADLGEIDEARQAAYDNRTDVNRTIRDLKGRLSGLPEVDAPDEEVSVKALFDELSAANKKAEENIELRDELKASHAYLQQLDEEVSALQKQLAEKRDERKSVLETTERLSAQVDNIVEPDLDSIQARIATSEETNKRVRQRQERQRVARELREAEQKADALTAEIEQCDARKQEAIAAAKLPVEGLSFDADGVSYQGQPFSQASSAEQLRVSVAMGLAMNPKLKVMLIRDGSLLDADNLALIGSMAESAEAQVWIERVGGDGSAGVLIEDGEVRA